MLLLKPGRVWEPCQYIAKRADREMNDDRPVTGIEGMRQNRRGLAPGIERQYIDPEANEPPLGREHQGPRILGLEENIAGVEISQGDSPLTLGPRGKRNARALVKVEPDTGAGQLGWGFSVGRIGRLGLHRGSRPLRFRHPGRRFGAVCDIHHMQCDPALAARPRPGAVAPRWGGRLAVIQSSPSFLL